MASCIRCKQETQRTGLVYVGTPVSGTGRDTKYAYEPYNAPICDHCVDNYLSGFSGVMFYAALQLGWLTVAQRGLLSPFGILGAAVAVFGLVRLFIKVLQWLLRGRKPETLPRWLRQTQRPEQDASAAVRSVLKKNARFNGKEIRTVQEQNRVQGRY